MRLAVNIQNPADLSASAASYHPTTQSIEFVTRLATAALEGGGAHALLGPYGAGKSSLAAFALNELSYPTTSFAPTARPHLFSADESPVARILDAGGLAPMPVVGASERLASRVILALKAFANSTDDERPATILQSCASLDPREATDEQALLFLTEVASVIRQQGKAGTLLVIDEFGRHLDHMLATASYYDFHSGEIRPMHGRVLLRPYYYVTGEEETKLAGIQAVVCPADKKVLHGMVDAVLVPCAVREG